MMRRDGDDDECYGGVVVVLVKEAVEEGGEAVEWCVTKRGGT